MPMAKTPKSFRSSCVMPNLKVTMDTYVQAVTDDKREAPNKVVEMLLPGTRRAAI